MSIHIKKLVKAVQVFQAITAPLAIDSSVTTSSPHAFKKALKVAAATTGAHLPSLCLVIFGQTFKGERSIGTRWMASRWRAAEQKDRASSWIDPEALVYQVTGKPREAGSEVCPDLSATLFNF